MRDRQRANAMRATCSCVPGNLLKQTEAALNRFCEEFFLGDSNEMPITFTESKCLETVTRVSSTGIVDLYSEYTAGLSKPLRHLLYFPRDFDLGNLSSPCLET